MSSQQSFSRVYKSAFDQVGDGKAFKIAGFDEITDFGRHNAGMVTVNDIADIKSVTVLEEVLGLARPQYVLNNACVSYPLTL
jgi:hypothetical protein